MKLAEKLEILEARALELMQGHGIPGVSLGLIVDGNEHYISLGVTSVLHPLPVTPDTLFQIGSTTKAFVATLTMKLIQDGLLELDAPIRRYIADFQVRDPYASERATIQHLLTHTGGWLGDFDLDTGDDTNALELYVRAMRDLPQLSVPGEMATYSNSGFVLLARILEVVSKKSLDMLMREVLLEPLALHDTVYWAHEAITKRTAIGHKLAANNQPEMLAVWRLPRVYQGDGGLVSSARDQLRFARFYLGQLGDDPIDARTRLEMQVSRQSLALGVSVGLCWLMYDHVRSGGTAIHTVRHGGHVDGFLSEFWFVPEQNFAFTSLTNCESGNALNQAIGTLVLELFLDVPPTQLAAINLPLAQLERFVGWYSAQINADDGINISLTEHGLMIEISLKSDKLEIPITPIQAISETVCAGFAEPLMGRQVEFFELGRVFGKLRSGGRIFVRAERNL